MPFFTKNNKTIFFSHIPKTGGSSVHRVLRSYQWETEFMSNERMIPCSHQHRHNTDIELINFKENYDLSYSFTIVREPLDRIVSEFNMMANIKKRKSGIDILKLKNFEKFVEDTFEEYKENNFIYDNHIRPQIEFIHEDMDVIKFGEWDNLMEKLYSFDNELTKKFPQHYKGSTKYSAFEYVTEELNWKISKNTIKLIKDFYSEDYKLYSNL